MSWSRTGALGNATPIARLRPKSRRYCAEEARKWQPYERSSEKGDRCGSVTVITLVADANIRGHVARLVARMKAEPWRAFWEYLEMRYVTFADLELDSADSD